MLVLGCKDNEQRARATGEAARAEAARACADAGPDEIEGCARHACDAPCGEFEGAQAFHRACVSACTANAECATDADCGAGLRCIAIAPRVRRCRPTPTSHTPVPGSAP